MLTVGKDAGRVERMLEEGCVDIRKDYSLSNSWW